MRIVNACRERPSLRAFCRGGWWRLARLVEVGGGWWREVKGEGGKVIHAAIKRYQLVEFGF